MQILKCTPLLNFFIKEYWEFSKPTLLTCVAGMPHKPPVNYEGWDGRYQFSQENTELYFLTLYIILLPFSSPTFFLSKYNLN